MSASLFASTVAPAGVAARTESIVKLRRYFTERFSSRSRAAGSRRATVLNTKRSSRRMTIRGDAELSRTSHASGSTWIRSSSGSSRRHATNASIALGFRPSHAVISGMRSEGTSPTRPRASRRSFRTMRGLHRPKGGNMVLVTTSFSHRPSDGLSLVTNRTLPCP